MADDLDDLLRRSMKTLDDQMPAGYFEGLPSRTLARLEDVSMQPMGTTGSDRDRDGGSGPAGVPPMTAAEREEDSGLHDIRSLASSTKARISSRRSTQNPVMSEDDILASSSAGWKAVALPEPAKMISLPELTELPSAKQVKEKEKAARKTKPSDAVAAPVVATATEAAPASISSISSISSAPTIGSRIAANNQRSGKGRTIALVGMGLAAAAGVTIYFAMNKQNAADSSSEQTAAVTAPAAEYKSTTKMLPPPPPAAAPQDTAAAAGSAAPIVQEIATSEPAEAPKAAATKGADKPGKVHKVEVRDTSMTDKNDKSKEKAAPKEDLKKPEAKDTGGDGEPSFDALLKEAGVSDAKKQAKPTLDKKSLSGGDIKTGMSAVAGKAQACYAGTQGAAAVKLTVAPSGQVQKVSVSGAFAGTPVAACVTAAVKSAQFPPWDGGPQTINYSYLLSE